MDREVDVADPGDGLAPFDRDGRRICRQIGIDRYGCHEASSLSWTLDPRRLYGGALEMLIGDGLPRLRELRLELDLGGAVTLRNPLAEPLCRFVFVTAHGAHHRGAIKDRHIRSVAPQSIFDLATGRLGIALLRKALGESGADRHVVRVPFQLVARERDRMLVSNA